MPLVLAVWTLLSFTLPAYSSRACVPTDCPIGDQLWYLSVECSHDSLAWHETARWGLRDVAPGSAFVIAAWPDTVAPVWYRVSAVDTSGLRGCDGNAVRVR